MADMKVNAHDVATAYGLLWLFTGTEGGEASLPLIHSARRHLRDLLLQDDKRAGIERAKEIADALGVQHEPAMFDATSWCERR